jgi:hypothetical protein
VGAGVLVGGFLAVGVGAVAGRARRVVEADSLRDGFHGGLLGIACMGPRNIYISLFVFILILFPGALTLPREDETAQGAVLVLAFISSFTVLHILDGRQRRRRGRE